ncbi:MAG: hypothetical protein P8X89_09280 [Reinekea sp.]
MACALRRYGVTDSGTSKYRFMITINAHNTPAITDTPAAHFAELSNLANKFSPES